MVPFQSVEVSSSRVVSLGRETSRSTVIHGGALGGYRDIRHSV